MIVMSSMSGMSSKYTRTVLVLLMLGFVASGQYQPGSDLAVPDNPCPASETSCILRHLVSRGLVRGNHQARSNLADGGEDGTANSQDDPAEISEQRSHRNSKYRPDCWGQGEAGEEQGRGARGTHRRGRGGWRNAAPCLWETSYYMGDTVET